MYRAQLAETLGIGVQSTFKRTVAVKTLKGKPPVITIYLHSLFKFAMQYRVL